MGTLEEIHKAVDHVEPWMSGNARGPSTAFCLLFHLFTLNLKSMQIKNLIDYKDSSYVRAIGFLYLRYVCSPKELWDWFEPYLNIHEKFSPSPPGTNGMKEVTLGEFTRKRYCIDSQLLRNTFTKVSRTFEAKVDKKA